MKPENHRALLEDLFPVGQERWIKVRYTDFDWCVKNLRLQGKDKPEDAQKLGFEVMAIGVRDEFVPQVTALMDVRDEVIGALVNRGADEYMLSNVRNQFADKIEEIKERTVVKEMF